jgi:pimeloyl-ACP methyl ester carboxylesterase
MMPTISRPDGTHIHYEVTGSGYPVLLLGPGIANSGLSSWKASVFDPIDVLSNEFKVIAIAQRHSGSSTGSTAPFSYEQAVADEIAVLDDIGVERTHVLGESSGCALAWRLGSEVPDRINAMVSVRPQGIVPGVNSLAAFLTVFDETMRLARAEGMAAVVDAAKDKVPFEENLRAGPFCQRLSVDPVLREQLLGLPVERYIALLVRFRDGLWPEGPPFFSVPTSYLRECSFPLLVLPGSDRLHPPEVASELIQIVPRAERLPDQWMSADDRVVASDLAQQFFRRHALAQTSTC